jgi:hypothetical protein
VKVLCSQEVVSPHLDGVVSCQVTKKASAPQVPWFVFCVSLRKGIRKNMVWSKTIDFYALSRCMGRKCTWMLAKIKYRKSQMYSLFLCASSSTCSPLTRALPTKKGAPRPSLGYKESPCAPSPGNRSRLLLWSHTLTRHTMSIHLVERTRDGCRPKLHC